MNGDLVEVMLTPVEWHEVVLSDEKNLTMDEPDGNKLYWHDLQTVERVFSTRQIGGGSVMVWAYFSHNGRSPIDFMEGLQNSECYVDITQQVMIPMAHTCHDTDWIQEQENAPIHVSKNSLDWFSKNGVAFFLGLHVPPI